MLQGCRLGFLLDPIGHDPEREPEVAVLAVVMGLRLPGEDPGRHRPGAGQRLDLHAMHLERDEMIVPARQDENILLHELGMEVFRIHLSRHVEGVHIGDGLLDPAQERLSFPPPLGLERPLVLLATEPEPDPVVPRLRVLFQTCNPLIS